MQTLQKLSVLTSPPVMHSYTHARSLKQFSDTVNLQCKTSNLTKQVHILHVQSSDPH